MVSTSFIGRIRVLQGRLEQVYRCIICKFSGSKTNDCKLVDGNNFEAGGFSFETP